MGLTIAIYILKNKTLKTAVEVGTSAIELLFTGSVYGIDKILGPIETVVFEEHVSIFTNN
jgi:hypothetical protein